MRGNLVLRSFLRRRSFGYRSLSSSSMSNLNQKYSISSSKANSSIPKSPSTISTLENINLSNPFMKIFSRKFCLPETFPETFVPSFEPEPEPPAPPNFVPLTSDEDFEAALSKAESESVPAVFYFTAVWCAPCRLIGPILVELARRKPHVTTFKLDIDAEGLANTIKKLNVTSVPTLHFYSEGEKKEEVVGADLQRLVQTMMNLYKKEEENKDDGKEEIKDDGKEEIKDEDKK